MTEFKVGDKVRLMDLVLDHPDHQNGINPIVTQAKTKGNLFVVKSIYPCTRLSDNCAAKELLGYCPDNAVDMQIFDLSSPANINVCKGIWISTRQSKKGKGKQTGLTLPKPKDYIRFIQR